jgi:hypothetical protein
MLERVPDGRTEIAVTGGGIAFPEIGIDLPLDAIYKSVLGP